MTAISLTPSQEALLQEIQELWKKIKAPDSKMPGGTWIRQVHTYTELAHSFVKESLTLLEMHRSRNPNLAASPEIAEFLKHMYEEIDLWGKCTDLLLNFATEVSKAA